MNFKHEIWKLIDLVLLHSNGFLDLNPHYQRNAIWPLSAQKRLIETIQRKLPIPSFFIRKIGEKKFEMVDGQQRARAIIKFWNGEFSDSARRLLNEQFKKKTENYCLLEDFRNYELNITLLWGEIQNREIEEFYTLVNSSGLKLNQAELRKASYYSTRFLKLVTELTDSSLFDNLCLFSKKSSERMNDIEFVSELTVFLKFGFSEKKVKVEDTFESDISDSEFKELYEKANRVLEKINFLNEFTPINRTRFKQKNDFYSLFAFIHLHPELSANFLRYSYELLLKLSPQIRPSQESCDPLMDYAINCVSQSNSKSAREERNQFFEKLLLNSNKNPNDMQIEILQFLKIEEAEMEVIEEYLSFPLGKIQELI